MSIHTEYQSVATCDICGDNYVEASWSQIELIKEIRKLGWSVGRIVKCPKCKRSMVVSKLEGKPK